MLRKASIDLHHHDYISRLMYCYSSRQAFWNCGSLEASRRLPLPCANAPTDSQLVPHMMGETNTTMKRAGHGVPLVLAVGDVERVA